MIFIQYASPANIVAALLAVFRHRVRNAEEDSSGDLPICVRDDGPVAADVANRHGLYFCFN